jgi:hypothetical protein
MVLHAHDERLTGQSMPIHSEPVEGLRRELNRTMKGR